MARYLVVAHLKEASPQRLVVLVPRLQEALARLSTVKPEQAFRSAGADLFGYCIVSDRHPQEVQAAIESPGKSHETEPILDGQDALMVIQLGEGLAAGVGFTRIATWLQRNK